jgi:hypothetical protein
MVEVNLLTSRLSEARKAAVESLENDQILSGKGIWGFSYRFTRFQFKYQRIRKNLKELADLWFSLSEGNKPTRGIT